MTINQLSLIAKEIKMLYLNTETTITLNIIPPNSIHIITHGTTNYEKVIPKTFNGVNIYVKHEGITITRFTAFNKYVNNLLRNKKAKKAYMAMTKKLQRDEK